MSTEKSTTEPEIAGYLKIKRGNFWVQRYVEINNGVLFYYKAKGDLDARCILHLKTASIGETWGKDKKREIIIKSPELTDGDLLKLKFNTESEFQSWMKIITDSTATLIRTNTATLPSNPIEEPKIARSMTVTIKDKEEERLESPLKNTVLTNESHIDSYSLDLNLLQDTLGDGLGLLKANVHQFKSETQDMMLVHNSNNLRIFQNRKHQTKEKTKPLKRLAQDIAHRIAKGFIIDKSFGPFYFFLILLIFFCLGFMSKTLIIF